MEYRRVGNSGLRVSKIGLGGNNFGGRLDDAASVRVIGHALDLGVNYIDTANTYAQGRSEEVIGRAIRGRRSEVIIATKFGPGGVQRFERQGASRESIMDCVDTSLKRLNTDYIDVYLLHSPDPETPILETLRALDDLVRIGKVRYIGANYQGIPIEQTLWRLSDALWTSRTHSLESFTVAGAGYNLLDRGIERELVPFCQDHGLGMIPVSPLNAGFLTGKYRRGQKPAEGPRVKGVSPRDMSSRLTEANFDKLEKFEAFARERGRNVGELALAWLLSHRWISTIIPGAMSTDQVTDNVAAADWELTAEDLAQLGTIP